MRWIALLLVAALALPAFADGNLTATMTGRTLTITGDDAANSVVIAPGGATDAISVTPTVNTTLNGETAAIVFSNVRSITVVMGAGNDRVDFARINLRGNVKVRLDDGNDTVFFTGTAIRGRVAVRGGAGIDTVRAESAAIFYGSLVVKGESENDELQFVSSQFRNRFRIEAGSGDDHVLVQSSVANETARVDVYAGRGLDLLEIVSSQFANDVFADLGLDNDRARVVSSKFTLDASMFGGLGADDVLSLEGVNTFTRLKTFDGFEEGQP